MRHADFGLSGKFDFAVSETVQRKSLHIHISKKASFDIPIAKYQRRMQATA